MTRDLMGANLFQKDEEFKLHPELAHVWREIIRDGLPKEAKKELLQSYPRKGNCPLQTPQLNPEMLFLLSKNKTAKSRDKFLAESQDLRSVGLVSIGSAIDMIFHDETDGIDKSELLKALCDSSRYMCELMHQLSKTRRVYLYPCVDEKHKVLLENAVTDDLLFGSDLSKRIKAVCSAEKISLTMRGIPER